MPRASAHAPTGDRTTCRPRPAGASGRVTTASSSWWESAMASSAGTATAGVPAKTSLISGDPPGAVVRAHLDGHAGAVPVAGPDLPHGLLAPGGVQPVEEQYPVEVVVLVLQAPRHRAGADDLHRVAVLREALRHHVLPAYRVDVDARYRQAALGAVLLLRVGELQHRVDQVPDDVVHVEREHAQAHADLRRGEPGAVVGPHRVDQVGDQLAQLLVEVGHRVRGAAQDGIAEQPDRGDAHAYSLLRPGNRSSLRTPGSAFAATRYQSGGRRYRCREPVAVVPVHHPEPVRLRRPVRPGPGDVLVVSADEVPPHHDLLGERLPAEQEYPRLSRQRQPFPAVAEVQQGAGLELVALDCGG